jgi:hypothetical protein
VDGEHMSPWQALGVATDIGVADLRRRYAALIKEFRPETHPQEFARIREAYEVALPHARRREAMAAETAAATAAAHVEESARPAPAAGESPPGEEAAPSDVADEAASVTEAVAPPPVADAPRDFEPEPEAEPALATHFRRFHEQAAAAAGSGDEAHLPALRALLQARSAATLDDSQALEFALMRWFIEAESPPLTLLFETGRAFDWHRHPGRLSSWLSPWALRQMEARLALSRDLVYARHFSGNAWLRRLHGPGPGLWRPVLRPPAVEARFWAERWRHASEDADAPRLTACLDPVTMRRLRGACSTDLLVGLAVAAFAPSLVSAALWAVVATAVVFGLRRLLQAIGDLPETHRARRTARAIVKNSIVAGGVAAAFGGVGLALLVEEPTSGQIALAALFIAPVALLTAALAWRVAAFVELVLAWPWLWREAVDRLEFDGLVRLRTVPQGDRPFGPRLGFVQRLASIRAALRFQATELATRERPPRARPFKLVRLTRAGGGPSAWRRLWIGLWILMAILRLVHAFGGGS